MCIRDSVSGDLFTAAYQASAFFFADFDVAQNLFELTFVDLSAHLRFFQPRQTDFDAVEAFSQFVYEFVVNAALYEDTGTGAADLALVEEDAEFGAFHSHVPLAVFKEDVG